jgi:membrane carboxypeptidase/penicillin-binding protein PbpC
MPSFGRNSWLSIGRPAAAKTGTTTDFRDNWVVGYTPTLVAGVWVGNADNTPMVEVTGLSGAGPIWNQFMREVLLGTPETPFAEPEGIIRQEVCALSGLLPTDACPLRRIELFMPGTVPTEPDTMYQRLAIDRKTGYLATAATDPADIVEQVFIVLPAEARDWAERNGIRQPPPGAPQRVTGDDGTLRFLAPDPHTIFQVSPLTPRDTQRIRLRVATPPDTESITLRLEEAERGVVLEETLTDGETAIWWTLDLGAYTLTAEATLEDGTVQDAGPLVFAVTDHEPPQQSYNAP